MLIGNYYIWVVLIMYYQKIKNNVDCVQTMGNTSGAFAIGIHKDIYNVILNHIKILIKFMMIY